MITQYYDFVGDCVIRVCGGMSYALSDTSSSPTEWYPLPQENSLVYKLVKFNLKYSTYSSCTRKTNVGEFCSPGQGLGLNTQPSPDGGHKVENDITML